MVFLVGKVNTLKCMPIPFFTHDFLFVMQLELARSFLNVFSIVLLFFLQVGNSFSCCTVVEKGIMIWVFSEVIFSPTILNNVSKIEFSLLELFSLLPIPFWLPKHFPSCPVFVFCFYVHPLFFSELLGVEEA